MKHILFISKSQLAQNLMELIVKTIPKKVDFRVANSLDELENHTWRKPLQLLIFDANVMTESGELLTRMLTQKAFKGARRILIHAHQSQTVLPAHEMRALGMHQLLAKPFLPEELIELIEKNTGGAG